VIRNSVAVSLDSGTKQFNHFSDACWSVAGWLQQKKWSDLI